jgi:hypothetical protein
MRENMSLLSFRGLVFALMAVTLFVVIYSYQKTKGANQNIVEDLRRRSVDIYLAAKTSKRAGRRLDLVPPDSETLITLSPPRTFPHSICARPKQVHGDYKNR